MPIPVPFPVTSADRPVVRRVSVVFVVDGRSVLVAAAAGCLVSYHVPSHGHADLTPGPSVPRICNKTVNDDNQGKKM